MRKILYILLTLPLFTFGQVQDSCYSVTDFMSQTETVNPAITKNFTAGWNMFGYPCPQSLDLVEALGSIIDKVIIVKNNNGSVYMPEFGFNGIGYLESGEGYQIKLSDTEYGFSFCESINWPDIEGCTDCEAVNFDQWANVGDGSCNYDSDGDGIDDADEIVGCQDSIACNYDFTATDTGECEFPDDFFNCDGTPQIGASYQGGILFYFYENEIGHYGLVAAPEDLIEGASTDEYDQYGYEWGCNNDVFEQKNGTAIGAGYQNTIDIVNENCSTSYGGIKAAQAAMNYELNGHNDWYLPSRDELIEIYNTIGLGGFYGNLGSFDISSISYSQYWSSSSESDQHGLNHSAWSVNFISGQSYSYYNENFYRVRPIRAFGNLIMGCMDSLACNYNPNANITNNNSCEYPEQGYNCDGIITAEFGDIMEGGYLFNIDETGRHGLVADLEDLVGGNWNNASTNTSNSGGYTDWYIPSINELSEMYQKIGNGSPNGNLGNFNNNYYWSTTPRNTTYYSTFNLSNGDIHYAYLYGGGALVRAVRKF